ncbi:hypothetical protein [Abyssalbus ytuae]|uniref:PKD domain-containing protein n=1 Tax=Abyssalbus ytuae TaxID=2926907 RepID=A0A9E7D187_9FLAO|nr:hypothetical protein [Abyssalbus ytuae]UOB16793.1 hypothetical protein MQE35_13735 [Abyssalbus ytuae]
MKILNFILSIVLGLSLIIACSERELDTSFIDNATAPSEVSVLATVSQDNSGVVTLTPSGTGVSTFDIVPGDGSETYTNVQPGSNIKHIYAEGEYEITVIARGINSKTTESKQNLVVAFDPPENLEVAIENDGTLSKTVNVTATADNAQSFDVYFGENDPDEPLSANIGETISYTYQDAGLYTITVVAKGAAIETAEYIEEDFEVTAILQPLTSAPTPPARAEEDVISIFSSAYDNVPGTNYFPDWGQGGQGSSWAMFDLNGDEILQYTNISYQGIALEDGTTVDISAMEYLHLDVWTTDVVTQLETSIINNAAGTVTEAPVTSDLNPNNWTSINIPVSAYTDQGLTVTEIFQLKFVGTPWAAGTVFIDNIYFWKEGSGTESIIFDDFEGSGNITTWAGDNCGMDNNYTNPFQEGINTSNTVLEYNDTGELYANIRFDWGSNLDLSQYNIFRLKIYVPSSSISGSQPNQISLKLQDGTAAEPWTTQTEIIKPIVLDQWQEVTFDFANDSYINWSTITTAPVDRTDLNRIVLQINSENNTDTVIAYIDDFNYHN